MRILLVEDSPGDARLLQEALDQAGLQSELTLVETVADGLAAEPHDIVLADLNVLDSVGVHTIQALSARAEPIIALTGLDLDELGEQALRAGAMDYLPKDGLSSGVLKRTLRHAIERSRLTRQLVTAGHQLTAAIEANPEGLAILTVDGVVALANPAVQVLLNLKPGDKWRALSDTVEQIRGGRTVHVRTLPTQWKGGEGRLLVARDVTHARAQSRELARRERQLNQAQALAALGRFSAGIAHEYNNGIMTLHGQLQELLHRQPQLKNEIGASMGVLERLSDVTRSVAAFHGAARSDPMPTRSLDQLVRRTQPVLEAICGPAVDLDLDLDAGHYAAALDDADVETILRNLVENAATASERGSVSVSTFLDEDQVVLEVRDDGPGVSPDVLNQARMPFFSTAPDRAGLGLTAVHGLMESVGGTFTLASGHGGTQATCCLPRQTPVFLPGPRTGTVLVVEDESALRRVLRLGLTREGFTVLEAADGIEALDLLDGVDIVLTDIRMPRMSGLELQRLLAERCPGLPVVMMSGYTDATPPTGIPFLLKPARLPEVIGVLSAALEEAARS